MIAIGTLIDLCLLWFLIVWLTGSLDAEQSYRETYIIYFGVMIVGVIFGGLLGKSLRLLATPVQALALLYLVEWSCGIDRKSAIKISCWYLLGSLLLHGIVHLLTSPA